MKKILLLGTLLQMLCISCSHKNPVKVPKKFRSLKNLKVYSLTNQHPDTMRLHRQQVFGNTDRHPLGHVGPVAVDAAGRVYIADDKQNDINVYKPNGQFTNQLGRKGKGPGEFQDIWDMKIHSTHLYVLDAQLFRISIFDLHIFQYINSYNLSFEGRQNVPPWWSRTQKKGLSYQPHHLYMRPDGSFLVLFSDNNVARPNNIEGRTYEASIFSPTQDNYIDTANDLLSFRWTGQVLVHKEKRGMIVLFGVPYKPSSIFDFKNGTFVVGWSKRMLFKFYNQNLAYQRSVYYPYSNVPFHLKDALTYYYKQAPKSIIRAIRSDSLPQKWPAFNALKLDDKGRLWVS
ncbi:MAG TPA: 6-bladed beta-propeller, partial [Balneolaceae bacterium]|nr:6-bladed beta-propeller [Balneolaceae bacterium]